MQKENKAEKLFKTGIIAAFATLAFVGTTIIRIPIPATGGYFNLGDTFVMTAALLYGPAVGGFVGLIGPALSDAVGFPQFILATGIVKCIEGIVVGASRTKPIIALFFGIIILAGGYFIFEAFIYPLLAQTIPFFGVTDPKAAIAEILPNLLQGIISAVIAFGISAVFLKKSG